MFTNVDGFEYNLYAHPTDTPQYLEPQPAIVNSIEFMDLTAPQHEDRRRRRSTTAQDKETISNMRIVSRSKGGLDVAYSNTSIASPSPKPCLTTGLPRAQRKTRSTPGGATGRPRDQAPDPRKILHRP